ncbi:hypothetical protein SDC9_180993 [bioreactor metagenome]|uniref:Uncharacterized protein n=1 Tax=bioreactor metagenome TaxID=1076179 RepID=A0A645H391_9ZZZZ
MFKYLNWFVEIGQCIEGVTGCIFYFEFFDNPFVQPGLVFDIFRHLCQLGYNCRLFFHEVGTTLWIGSIQYGSVVEHNPYIGHCLI